VAPEHIEDKGGFYWIANPSKESDVYSLAMTSFSVCTFVGNHLLDTIIPLQYQVLTGVLPYHGSNVKDTIAGIRAGKRPPRPIDSNQGLLLQDHVWDVITTGWHDQLNQRCKLSIILHAFQPPSL